MKAMGLAFATIIVIALSAAVVLNSFGVSSAERYASAAVRLN
ncbi:MAG: hypothetical protein P9C36_04830 [Defluviicoccus sp.]|nr:hypothetical protein [Defluviicoccus sp.]MDG4591934.1 hypothetical protein [Defluviicoccus sp.]MDS4011991.1 hypothetical protein [Defluviicoccus sp.]MDS4071787.1 hypothetical protein [Defluviicoccus sp.]